MEKDLRKEIIHTHHMERLSHCASALSCLEILECLYGKILKSNDKFILSKGHAKTAWKAVLKKYRWSETHTPTCALGNGLGIGCGMAILNYRTYVLLSDGECQEGSTWEAAMFAGHHKLNNLTAIVDYNKWQACGRTTDILDLEPFADKWASFGWAVREVDGHCCCELQNALEQTFDQPSVIIAHTIKGKGLPDEDSNTYHYKVP